MNWKSFFTKLLAVILVLTLSLILRLPLLARMTGALIAVFFLGALFDWLIVKRLGLQGIKRVGMLGLILITFSTLLGGFGSADGGPPKFELAFGMYFWPVIIFMIVEGIVGRTKRIPS